MFDFKYFAPTKVLFGKNTEEKVADLIKEFGGSHVLIHYGGGSVIRSGLMDKVTGLLDAAGIKYVKLGGAVPNPRLQLVYDGIELAKKENGDFLLALGGGSAIDSAKAIGYGLANGGDVWDFYAGKRKAEGATPLGVILTLAATGSEMSDSSVITKEDGLIKKGYSSDFGRPKFAIMNPELTMTLPDYQTASGCTDIMMHTMERYFHNGGGMELTDSMAEALLRTVKKNAVILRDDPGNYDARAEVMWAGSLSHNGLTGCGTDGGDWMSHKLEHEIGGLFDVAHGAGLAVTMPAVFTYELSHNVMRFAQVAVRVWGCQMDFAHPEVTAKAGIEAFRNFLISIGMPKNFEELGAKEEDIPKLVDVLCRGDGRNGTISGFITLNEEECAKIYKMMI